MQSQGRGRRGEGGERAGLEEYGDSDGDEYEEDGIHTPRTLSHRRRSQRDGHELDEVDDEDEDEDGDGYGHNHTSRHRLETTLRSRNHAEELLFQRRQSAHSQLPRRLQPVPSQYENDYDPDVIRQERSTRRGAREGGMRRRQNGSEDAPPRYEDHVFDRVVGGGDDDDA